MADFGKFLGAFCICMLLWLYIIEPVARPILDSVDDMIPSTEAKKK